MKTGIGWRITYVYKLSVKKYKPNQKLNPSLVMGSLQRCTQVSNISRNPPSMRLNRTGDGCQKITCFENHLFACYCAACFFYLKKFFEIDAH